MSYEERAYKLVDEIEVKIGTNHSDEGVIRLMQAMDLMATGFGRVSTDTEKEDVLEKVEAILASI